MSGSLGRFYNVSSRRIGLPVTVKMRHDAHYVEDIISRSGAAIGRMIAIEQIQPNADQPRKDLGDLKGLIESVREKGVLEPLLVRFLPQAEKYMIISGERRYQAARAAGLREVLCIEKGVLSKSQLLQVARQPTEAKMRDLIRRFALGTLNREQARAERNSNGKAPSNFFRFVAPSKEFKLVLRFRRKNIRRDDVIQALRRILETLENHPPEAEN